MKDPFIIVGHGLAGCALGMTFFQKSIPFKILGCGQQGEASLASSGLIAPVTGRRYVKSWMIDELIDEAIQFYSWTEELLGEKYFFPVDIIRFLSHPEAEAAWHKRQGDPEYARYISNKKIEALDRMDRKYGIVTGGYRLNSQGWINSVREFLISKNLLEIKQNPVTADELSEYSNVIFATGAIDHNFDHGIIPNKGEALIVKMTEWPHPGIIKEELFFVPLGDDTYWIGSFYDPGQTEPSPTVNGKQRIMEVIQKIHKGSFMVLEHLAGIRPTVDDRRPLIGPLPGRAGRFMFNGMGTKGTSLAPYWAKELIAHLTDNKPLSSVVDPARY